MINMTSILGVICALLVAGTTGALQLSPLDVAFLEVHPFSRSNIVGSATIIGAILASGSSQPVIVVVAPAPVPAAVLFTSELSGLSGWGGRSRSV